MLIYFEHYINV